MTDKYAALREAAEKATPEQYVMGSTPQDALYIAAASPAVMLGLLEDLHETTNRYLEQKHEVKLLREDLQEKLDRLEFLESERAKDLDGFVRLQQRISELENTIESHAAQCDAGEQRIAELEKGLGDGVDGIFDLRKQNDALREMLKTLQWDDDGYYCNACLGNKTDGHYPHCDRLALLETSA